MNICIFYTVAACTEHWENCKDLLAPNVSIHWWHPGIFQACVN